MLQGSLFTGMTVEHFRENEVHSVMVQYFHYRRKYS
jgi:hypothetical protein